MGRARAEIERSLESTYDLDVEEVRCPTRSGRDGTALHLLGDDRRSAADRRRAPARVRRCARVEPTAAVLLIPRWRPI